MKNITVTIPDNKINFFIELVQNLGFKINEMQEAKLKPEQKEFVEDLKNAMSQVDLHLKGEIKLNSAKDLLNEL